MVRTNIQRKFTNLRSKSKYVNHFLLRAVRLTKNLMADSAPIVADEIYGSITPQVKRIRMLLTLMWVFTFTLPPVACILQMVAQSKGITLYENETMSIYDYPLECFICGILHPITCLLFTIVGFIPGIIYALLFSIVMSAKFKYTEANLMYN